MVKIAAKVHLLIDVDVRAFMLTPLKSACLSLLYADLRDGSINRPTGFLYLRNVYFPWKDVMLTSPVIGVHIQGQIPFGVWLKEHFQALQKMNPSIVITMVNNR